MLRSIKRLWQKDSDHPKLVSMAVRFARFRQEREAEWPESVRSVVDAECSSIYPNGADRQPDKVVADVLAKHRSSVPHRHECEHPASFHSTSFSLFFFLSTYFFPEQSYWYFALFSIILCTRERKKRRMISTSLKSLNTWNDFFYLNINCRWADDVLPGPVKTTRSTWVSHSDWRRREEPTAFGMSHNSYFVFIFIFCTAMILTFCQL